MTQRGLDKMQTVLNSGTQHYIYNVIKLLQPGNACCQCYDLLYVDWLVAVMFLHLINAATWVPAQTICKMMTSPLEKRILKQLDKTVKILTAIGSQWE